MIRFTVYDAPVAQPRQRSALIAGHVRTYTPRTHPVQDFKQSIKAAALTAGLPSSPWEGWVVLECIFLLPRPKSLMRKKDPEGFVIHNGKPDAENLAKAVMDALTGLLWRDDAQVWRLLIVKAYHEKAGRPRLELRAWELRAGLEWPGPEGWDVDEYGRQVSSTGGN